MWPFPPRFLARNRSPPSNASSSSLTLHYRAGILVSQVQGHLIPGGEVVRSEFVMSVACRLSSTVATPATAEVSSGFRV